MRKRLVSRSPGGGVLVTVKLAFALAIPLAASAQLKVPDLPAIPTVPALPSVPKLPSVPSLPAMPSVPKLPAVPSGLPKLPTAPPAASGKPPVPPPAPPAGAPAPADTSPTSAPQDVDIIVGDKKDEDDSGPTGVPATLPPELRRNLKPGTATADSAKGLTIEQIVDVQVVSASSRLEGSRSAPALVYVLSARDLRARGYNNLSEMFDDLPEMDVIRPYGGAYYRNYWRGYRMGTGAEPYLVLIDGVSITHLITGDNQILAAFPLSCIDHIEIVYGPASALYGANAETGIINIITKTGEAQQKRGETGTFLESRLTYGGSQRNLTSFEDSTHIADAMALHVNKDFRLRLSARLESSVLDRAVGDRFEYTQDKYYTDPTLWGNIPGALPGLAGGFYSPDRKRAVEGRFYAGNLEIGAGYYELNTGEGTRHPGDRFQTQAPRTTSEVSLFGRYSAKLSAAVMTTMRLNFRDSRLASPSSQLATLSAADGSILPGAQLVSFEAPGQSFEARNDWNVTVARSLITEADSLDLGFGVQYAHSRLTRNVTWLSQTVYSATSTNPTADAVILTPRTNALLNMRSVDEFGVYALAKYALPSLQALHLGVRVDTSTLVNSTNATVRGGYAGTFDRLTLKALYGQAVYAPTSSDLQTAPPGVTLKVERSQTLEGNVAYTLPPFAFQGDVYYMTFADPIVDRQNVKEKTTAGATLGARMLLNPVQVWAYYTHYFLAKVSTPSGDVVDMGDIAYDKVLAGFTYDRSPFTATLLGRFIGTRHTVPSNPVREIPWYITLDANLVLSHIFFDGLWFGLRCTNILDWKYSHPGIGYANSGNTPASRDAAGIYHGSLGTDSSLLPQPGRSFFASLGLDLY